MHVNMVAVSFAAVEKMVSLPISEDRGANLFAPRQQKEFRHWMKAKRKGSRGA